LGHPDGRGTARMVWQGAFTERLEGEAVLSVEEKIGPHYEGGMAAT